MRTLWSHLRFVAPVALFATPVLAAAPEDYYSFFDRNSPTIQDPQTLLEWERFNTRTLKTFGQAEVQCQGFAGSRIPTIKELLTIFDESPHQEYEFGKTVTRYIDQDAFGKNTGVDAAYWSSTPVGISKTKVWGLSFADGSMVELDTTATAYARCVR